MSTFGDLGDLKVGVVADVSQLAAARAAMTQFARSVTEKTKKVNATLATVSTAISGIAMRMRSLGWLAITVLTAPLLMIGKSAGKMAMEFEASMTKIISLVGVAREQVEAWESDVLALSAALGRSPQELADALFYITSAGIRGSEAMDILEYSAKAAAVGLGETKVVADLVTSAMNAYGAEVLPAAQATDVLVAAVREGKIEASELASKMGMVIPVASAMGVSFAEVGAASAAMSRTGTNASMAAVQLRQILVSILKPSKQAEDQLWALGTSSSYLRKTIREDGLLATLMELKERFGTNETAIAKVFGNVRALSGVLDILGENLEDNIAIWESVEGSIGDTDAAFREIEETIEFQINQALSKLKTSAIAFGKILMQQLIPIINKFVARIQAMADKFTQLTGKQQQSRIKLLLLLAAIGPATLALSVLGLGISVLLPLVGYLTTAFVALNVAMAANPVIAAVTSVVAAIGVAVAVYRRISNAAERAAESHDKFSKSVKHTISVIKGVGADGTGSGIPDITAAIEQMQNAISALDFTELKELKEFLENELDRANEVLNDTSAWTIKMTEAGAFDGLINQMERFEKALEMIDDRLDGFASSRRMYNNLIELEGGVDAIRKSLGQLTSNELNRFKEFLENDMVRARKVILENSKITADWADVMADKSGQTQFGDVIFGGFNFGGEEIERLEQMQTIVDELIKSLAITAAYELTDDAKIKKIIETMEDQIYTIDNVAYAYKVLGLEYDVNKEKADVYNKALHELASYGYALTHEQMLQVHAELKALGPTLDEQKKKIEELRKEYEKAIAPFSQFSDQLVYIERMSSIMGDGYDKQGEQLKAYEKALQDLVKNYDVLTTIFPSVLFGFDMVGATADHLKGKINSLKDTIKDLADAQHLAVFNEQLANDLDTIAVKMDIFGKSFDGNRAMVNRYSTAITYLIENFDTTKDSIRELIDELMRLRDEVGKPLKFKEMFDQIQLVGQKISETLGAFQGYVGALQQQALKEMEDTAKRQGWAQERIAKEREKIEKEYGARIKRMAIAQAIINGAVAVTNLLTRYAGVMNPAVWAAIALTGAITAAQVATISATPMATGGIIPPGYPNDTFPALLTSGEKVIPLGRDDVQEQKMDVTIHGKVDGQDLKWVLEEVEYLTGRTR